MLSHADMLKTMMGADGAPLKNEELEAFINAATRQLARTDNESGLLGVRWHKRDRRWHARIMVDGAPKHLGSFGTSDEAQAAYLAAKRQLHEFGEIAKETRASMSAS